MERTRSRLEGLIEGKASADIPSMGLFERVRRLDANPRAGVSADQAGLAALHKTTLALLDRQNPEDLLETIVERAGGLLGTRHGYLYLLEPSGDELRVHVGTGIFRDLVNHRLPVGEGLRGRVARTGEPLVVDDYSTWDGAQAELRTLRFRAVVGVPLCGGGQVIGVIGLAHLEPDRSFGPSETGARIAERFRRELSSTPLGVERPIAATFGVASFPADGSTAAELLRAADRALYLAKERGGNQTLALSNAA